MILKLIENFINNLSQDKPYKKTCYSCIHSIYSVGPEWCELAEKEGYGKVELMYDSVCNNYKDYRDE